MLDVVQTDHSKAFLLKLEEGGGEEEVKEEEKEEEEGKESILVFRSPRGSFFQSEWLRYALKN